MAINWDTIEAKTLQRCLDMVIKEGLSIDDALSHFPSNAEALRPELEAALWLKGSQQAFAPRPGFIASSRKHLVHQIKRGSPQAKSKFGISAFQRPIFRLAFTLLLVFAIILSSTGIASASALPGDTMYAVKLSWENTRLNLIQDIEKEAQLHLRYADSRIGDVESLVEPTNFNYLALTFENYRTHTQSALDILLVLIDQQLANELVHIYSDTITEHIRVLGDVQARVPIEIGVTIDVVVDTLGTELASVQQIQDEAQNPASSGNETPLQPTETQTEGSAGDESGVESSTGDSETNAVEGEPQPQQGDNQGNGEGNGDQEGQSGDNDDEKDGNPDDDNQGGGNDDVKDGNPDDGNQGGGNDDKEPKEDKDKNKDK